MFDFSVLGENVASTSKKENEKVRHLGEVALNDGPLVVRGLIKALGKGPLTLAGFTAKKDFEKVSLVLAIALLSGGKMTAEKIRDIEILSRSKGEDQGRKRAGDKRYDRFRDPDPDTGEDGFNVRLLRWMLRQVGETPILEGDSQETVARIKAAEKAAKEGEEAEKADKPTATTDTVKPTAKASKASGKKASKASKAGK